MTRRAAAGLARLLPLLLIAAAVAVLLGAGLLAACGGSSGGSSPQPTVTVTATASADVTTGSTATPSGSPSESPAETTLRLYFLRGDALGVAERRVDHTSAPARAALSALFAGPTTAEQAAGLSTSLAPGIEIESLTISGGLARVDLSAAFWRSGESLNEAQSLLPEAQIVYTLTQFPSVRRVAVRVDGDPYPAAGSNGSASAQRRRRDFADYEPPIFVEAPGVGAVVSSPFTLRGAATVFEGSFLARLTDSSGRRIVQVVVQASLGAPERGHFAQQVPYSTSARRGTLIVFAQSMEDGSRQHEVRIPVTFAD
jgi:hypothetical protein